MTLSAILAFFFLDEVTSLHGTIDGMSGGKALYLPLLALAAACVWRLMLGAGPVAGVGASLALLSVAYLMHLFALYNEHSAYLTTLYQAKVGLKEGTELAGLLLAVWALGSVAGASTRGAMADCR